MLSLTALIEPSETREKSGWMRKRVLLHHTFFPFETLLLYAGKILYLLVVASNIPLRLPAKGEYTFFAKVRLSNLRDLFSL